MTTTADGSAGFLEPEQVTNAGGIPQLRACSGPVTETKRGGQEDASVKG